MSLPVPFIEQRTDYTCGPASLRMVFAYFGKEMSADKMREITATTQEYGTKNKLMVSAAKDKGFYCYYDTDNDLAAIKAFLDQHIPVIVNYIEPSDEEGHYAVVVGLTDTEIILNDPWNGQGFTLTHTDFKKRWIDKAKEHPRWLLALSTEPITVE